MQKSFAAASRFLYDLCVCVFYGSCGAERFRPQLATVSQLPHHDSLFWSSSCGTLGMDPLPPVQDLRGSQSFFLLLVLWTYFLLLFLLEGLVPKKILPRQRPEHVL